MEEATKVLIRTGASGIGMLVVLGTMRWGMTKSDLGGVTSILIILSVLIATEVIRLWLRREGS